jgi:hypothetical protein
MRKNIGWQDKQEDAKYEIRVLFDGGDRILWRRNAKHLERWEPFAPTPEHWATLVEKVRARYVRRQAPFKDLQLVERLRQKSVARNP